MKKIMPILFLVLLSSLVSATTYDMCSDSKEINSNCTMLTPTLLCAAYNYTIISVNGTLVESGNLTNLNGNIYYFNFTQGEGYYLVGLCDGTTREVIVKPNVGSDGMLGIIILLPLLLCIFLIIGSATMNEEHNILRIFMFLLSMPFFFITLNYAMLMVVKFYDFPELQEALGTLTYWVSILFVTIILYFVGYFIYKATKTMGDSKQHNMEY